MRRCLSCSIATLALILVTGKDVRAQIVINELRIDHPGTDTEEYFELAGPASASLDGLWYLVIGDGSGGNDGIVEEAIDLAGLSLTVDGYFVCGESTLTLGLADLIVADLWFENSDNVTHMLVEDFIGSEGDDLDTLDDGVLDVTPWTAIVDQVALVEEPNPPTGGPPSGTEWSYGLPAVGPAGGFVPSHIYRCPDTTGDFLLGDFGIPTLPVTGPDSPGLVNTCPTCLVPTDLVCISDCPAAGNLLTWTNAQVYDSIEIEIDGGAPIVIGGTDSSYLDSSPAPGLHNYIVTAFCSATVPADPVECSRVYAPYAGERHLIFAAEGPAGGIDSITALATELDSAGESVLIVDQISAGLCMDDFAIPGNVMWVLLGTYPDKAALSSADGALLVELVSAGVHVYIESADTWAWDAAQPFMEYDGVDDTISNPFTIGWGPNGDDTFTMMNGLAYGPLDLTSFVDVVYEQDQIGASDFTDQLVAATTDLAGASAGTIWENVPDALPDPTIVETVYATGVYYDTDSPFGKVICQTWEFGGFAGDQAELLGNYLDAFPIAIADTFVRGDANSDGTYDISDAVFSLGALFLPSSPAPDCADTADSNDDGGFDISDAVYTLSALFLPSSPLPTAPHPGCGPDPTPDSLDCASFGPCP